MFKKKGSKDSTLKSSGKVTKEPSSSLVALIAKMQQNADTVEKHILRSEELMAVDAENEKNDKPFLHQTEIKDRLGEAEGLLKELFLEVDKAKKAKHPQAKEIENDVIHLHERWLKDCAFYRDIYEQIDDVSLMPIIDWGPVFSKKQNQVTSEEYGPGMADLEKQIAAHNILHKEVEAYNAQLCVSSAGSKEKYTELKKQYNKMLDNSKWRRHYLTSLYDYMHGCNKELNFLAEEQNKIKKQDWSDRMVDPPDVRRQYENFKNNSLLSHEGEVNKFQDEGDRLIELKHPASATIQAQRDNVRAEWQKFLNLCICQETHLDNVEEYKKYQMDAEQLSENLTKLNNSLDPKSLSKQNNSETLFQLNLEEKSVQDAEKQLADLRKRSTSIAPLKLRRNPVNRPITVESLCDWDTDRDSLTRGEKLTLKSNADTENWDVVAANGATKTFPGVCLLIPPPDADSIDQVDLLGRELTDIKKRRAILESSLKNHKSDSLRAQHTAPVSSAPLDPKVTALGQELSNLDKGLTNAENDLLSRIRAPLSRSDPSGDLAKRLRDQEQAARALRDLEQKRLGAQTSLKALPNSGLSSLPLQLSGANNKADKLAALSDLYKKKANASLNLEGQINKVDGLVSGFEKKLSEDGPILDGPNALQASTDDIRSQSRSVAAAQDDMKKLSQDLETTEQLCSSLQQSYQEYCPDIQRQRTEVKTLQNRYENVSNQLKEREHILQEAGAKNQEFQSTSRSLNSFLENLPKNQINSSDSPSQIAAKQSSQERVIDDLKRKEDDMHRVTDLSQDLQSLLNQYDSNVEKFNSTVEDNGMTAPRSSYTPTLAEAVQKQEKDLVSQYAETSAENAQRQKQMALARNLIVHNEEKVHMVEQQQVQQQQNSQRSALELSSLMRELDEEKERAVHTENNLRTFRDRMMSLKNRRGVERIEEKEVLQYYRDPKLESDLSELQSILHEESSRRSTIHTEVEVFKNKIVTLEETIKNAPPKLATREVTEFEKDPQLDIEAAKLRDEISRMRDEIRVKDSEHIQIKSEVSILQQKRPTIKERIVKKEVVKVEQDPEMLKAVRTFELEISDESNKSKHVNDQIFQTRSEINALERLIPYIQPKVITKEVKKVEQDPELINESRSLKTNLESEKIENISLSKEVTGLQSRYRDVQDIRPKVEVKEIVNEIYRIDPTTEVEIMRLRKDIQDSNSNRLNLDRDLTTITSEINVLRSQKPKVEVKEVLQEVVKEERSPENEREIQRLNDQLTRLNSSFSSLNDQVRVLRRDRDEWKAEKSKIETRVVTKEVIKYEPDPLLEKEAERLRRDVREYAQLRRTEEEMVFDLKNKCILLERQKPEERVVVQEVVRLQKDPRQIADHERLGRSLDDEVMTRRQLELELQKLRTTVEDKLRIIRENEEHQKLLLAQSEIREIRTRIMHLENAPPPVEESIVVEEVLKVERDPKLERKTIGVRSEMDKETNDILRIQREIRTITAKLEILQREKSNERTVYKEIVRVEKDQAVESARDRLREEVSQHRFSRQDLEDELRRIKDKTNQVVGSKSTASREETSLISNKEALLREKDNLTRELRTLETKRQDINISFQQQTRLISERSQMSRQRSHKMESDVQRLEREILEEKDRIHQRDTTIRDLMLSMQKEEQAETRTKETNVSTKITILDPETGRDMSPYDAYLQGLIDRKQYIHLQELECDWEESTTMGPDGETSVLQDRKSGKQYSIKEALKAGRVKESDLLNYKAGKMPISEFALLVAGEKNKAPEFNSIIPKTSTTVKSAPFANSTASEPQPVAGIIDTNTDTCYTIRSATMRKLIDSTTAQRLLEAQAATGGIIDISTREKYSVNKASTRNLIEDSQIQRLLNAQKAFSGVEDPMTRECLSVGEAVQKGWMPKETATRYMEAQHLTGGLVNPKTGARVSILDAIGSKMIDNTMMRELQSERTYTKEIVDPLTKEKINYKQALDRCKKDPISGLLMLPASSKDSGYNSTYSSRYAKF